MFIVIAATVLLLASSLHCC